MKGNGPFSIAALWVHPRSMSTAIERIMRERGDLSCFHEPFIYYYYVELGKKKLPHSDLDAGRPTTFRGIVRGLEEKAKYGRVFFKDMSYYVLPEIFRYPYLADRMDHLILVRNPRKSILSHYKLDPGITRNEVGLEAQWILYQWLKENSGRSPFVLEAERVQQDPVQAMTRVWSYLGLDVKPGAFEWEEASIPADWRPVSGWHRDVMASTGIRQQAPEDEQTVNQRFEEAAGKSPRLRELLEYHLPFYEKLKSRSGFD